MMNPTFEPKRESAQDLKALFELEQGGRKRKLLISKERVVVGSVESADIKLLGEKIAPIHALIEMKLGATSETTEIRVVDLASPIGLSINGKKVLNDVIRPGDLLQVGDAIIKFSLVKPELEQGLPDQALMLIDQTTVEKIFDYRPNLKDALEVVYSWNGVILDVKHFGLEESVVVGPSQDQDFMVPPVFSVGGQFRIASRSAQQWTLHLDQKMSGVLYLDGKIVSVEDFVKISATGALRLGVDDFVKIQMGALTFYFSQTVSPPSLRNQTRFVTDAFFWKSLIASLAVTALSFLGLSVVNFRDEGQVNLTPEVTTILYHPEKYGMPRNIPHEEKKEAPKEEPKAEAPKKAEIDFTKPRDQKDKKAQTKSSQPGKKQASQNKAKEGAGAKAKGAEGARGSKTAQVNPAKQAAANRPSPEAGKGRGGTVSQAVDNGNVQMLKGATDKILDLFGGSGQKIDKSGTKLAGFSGFDTQGSGGRGLKGEGKGGGGNADTLLGGTSDHGRGGGKVGTGLGAEGTGTGIVGGKTRVDLQEGGGDETVVIGSIDRDAIDAAIRAHRDEFRYCYEREVNAGHPNLAGKIVSAFVIGGSGRATQMSVSSSSMGSPNVENCVLATIGRIKEFPKPAGGVPVTIKYPFAYTNASK